MRKRKCGHKLLTRLSFLQEQRRANCCSERPKLAAEGLARVLALRDRQPGKQFPNHVRIDRSCQVNTD